MVKIAPSILAADFSALGAEIDSISGADYIHFDVMDGHFVPNISFGLPVLSCLSKGTDMPMDVHLMIDKPSVWAERFVKAGADIVTMHLEADTEEGLSYAVKLLHDMGKRVGLSIKPGTPVEELLPWLDKIDLALVMTVEPGFGGQSFMEDMMPKVSTIRRVISEKGLACELQVDGGVNLETAAVCIAAGADVLVAGSAVFRAENRDDYIEKLRNA